MNLIDINSISESVGYMTVSLNNSYNLKLVRVYAPRIEHEADEVETFYDNISDSNKILLSLYFYCPETA